MNINFVNCLPILKVYCPYSLLRLFVFIIVFVALLIESIKSRIFINTRTVPISNVFTRVWDCISLYLSWIFVNTIVIETSNYQLIYRFLTTHHYFLLLFYYLSYYDVYNITIGIIYWPISYRGSILLKITCTYVYGVIIFNLTGERP